MPVKAGGWVALGGGLVVLAAAGGLLAGRYLFADSEVAGIATPAAEPTQVELPDVTKETAVATLDYLERDGKMLLDITKTKDGVRLTSQGGDAGRCRAMTGDLNKDYPADTVLDRLHAMPDPVMGEWLATYYGSAFGALDACAQHQQTDDYLADADTALTQIDRRIAQLKGAK
jgi:hypothetical protein